MDTRIRFSKFGPVKYIGHLDLMRYFQKAIRRSGLPVSFTKGFSPHPVLSFASPLGVGITSEGEYMDISLDEEFSIDEIGQRLSAEMAEGVEILSVSERSTDRKAMAELSAASYLVYFKEPMPGCDRASLERALQEKIKEASELTVTKKTKKSERTVDLLPLIYEIEVVERFPQEKRDHYLADWDYNGFLLSKDDPAVYMKVCARSSDNLKPELLIGALLSAPVERTQLGVHRLDMFMSAEDGSLLSLGGGQ